MANQTQQVISALRKAGHAGLTNDQIIAVLYGSRDDGGPLHARRLVRVLITWARAQGHDITPYRKYNRYIMHKGTLPPPKTPADVLSQGKFKLYKAIKHGQGLPGTELAERVYAGDGSRRNQTTIAVMVGRINPLLAQFGERIVGRPYRVVKI